MVTRVFLDANVLFAATASSTGGSAYILRLCQKKEVEGIVSHLVLLEARRNICQKLGAKKENAFEKLIKRTPLFVVTSPTEDEIKAVEKWIHWKDVPILAAALKSRANYLVTLDRTHFLDRAPQIRESIPQLDIINPKDFLAKFKDCIILKEECC